MTSDQKSDAGFTLIELLVVLAIASIVFGLSAYSLTLLSGRTSPREMAGRIANLLDETRFSASDNGVEEAVSIDMEEKRIWNNRTEVRVPAKLKLDVTTAKEVTLSDGTLQIVFLPDGTCSGAKISVTGADGKGITLQTNWLTGLTDEGADER